jgi:phenylalanyl-tRNA synthetase beta chain
MRVSLEWLGEFIDLPPDGQLTERLEMGGFEDVAVEQLGPDLSAIRVGRVVRCSQHPNADKLSLCSVDVGEEAPRQIVCGAPNVAAGQKVAVAVSGVRLPDGTKLKKSKIRGELSQGMICSTRELGLGDDHDGILVLDGDAPVGAPLPDVMRTGTRVLEVGITPNRGDTASLLGLAREVQALFGGDLRVPETRPSEDGPAAAELVRVEIDAPDDCHHYAARVVRDVRIAPSPRWLQERLEACGVRAINNVVDVTNLVLLELGQPLHAFDLAKLEGGLVRVRRAAEAESLVTLDGQTRRLDPRDLVIADATRAIALAGVMGGADSEVGEGTTDVLIESAHFRPVPVRLTARRHGLHSEASYRFERGVDREGIVRAADRAALLLSELAGGRVAPGVAECRGAAPRITQAIEISIERVNRLLGTALGAAEAAGLLERVGVGCSVEGGRLRGEIPSHRNDLHLPEDLVEEIARIHGYERIPTTLPVAQLQAVKLPPGWVLADRARDALAATGLVEVMTMPFVSPEDLSALQLDPTDPRRASLRLKNPIQERESELRTTLLPSLLRVTRQNLARQVDRVAIFEVARVFLPQGEGALPEEPLWLCAVLSQGKDRHLWAPRAPAPLFFEARGIAERLLSALGYVASYPSGGNPPYLHPGAGVAIEVGDQRLGTLGEIHPKVAAAFEIEVPCAAIELNLGDLLAEKKKESQFREVSREPAVRRDVAFLLDRRQAAGEVLEAVHAAGGRDLISAELFDRYEGKGVPEEQVSLAFRLVFQRADRTLVDAEVSRAVDRVVRAVAQRFGATLREGGTGRGESQ